MFRPKAFDVTEPDDLYELIAASGPAHLVTQTAQGLIASVVPMLLDRDRGQAGALLGHLARANPHWLQAQPGQESLAILPGPDAYVTPSFYASKQITGEVVPTWNYVAVHVYGDLIIHDDPTWVGDLVARLTDHHEHRRAEPWSITDAPKPFIERALRAVVGIELAISRIEGKRKLSQNRPADDVAGVIAGLTHGTSAEQAVAQEMQRPARPRPA